MIAEDATRNFGAKPGYALHDSIDLDGWGQRSIWGYDDGVGSFYAQLWRNPGDREAPDVWLSGAAPRYPWPGSLDLAVVEATRRDPVSVVRALGLADPNAFLRAAGELTGAIDRLPNQGRDPYEAGQLAVYQWAISGAGPAPGSWLPWNGQKPTAEHATAEQYMITARVYQPHDATTQAWVGGADEALAWALSRE